MNANFLYGSASDKEYNGIPSFRNPAQNCKKLIRIQLKTSINFVRPTEFNLKNSMGLFGPDIGQLVIKNSPIFQSFPNLENTKFIYNHILLNII